MERLVKLGRNEVINEKEGEIIISDARYETVPIAGNKRVFEGNTLPIPLSLVFYLKYMELKVFSFILDEIRRTGHCLSTTEDIADAFGVRPDTAMVTVEKLKKMGVVYVRRKMPYVDKLIDFKMVQKIEQLASAYGYNKLSQVRKDLGVVPPIDIPSRLRMRINYQLRKEKELENIDPIELEEYK